MAETSSTHLSHRKSPKPVDLEWAKYCGTLFQVPPNNNNPSSSCVSILLLERFQREREKEKKGKDHVLHTWRKLCPFTHPADSSAWCGTLSVKTHNLCSTYQSEPWILAD